jgi:predicted metalloprotease with PDZ domain
MFAEVMNGIGVDVRPDIAAFVDRGAPIAMADDVFAPCGLLRAHTAPVFSRGFDIAATQAHNNVISGVDPALPAYAAGLRDGMVLIRRDHGAIGDSEQEIAYVVLVVFMLVAGSRFVLTMNQLDTFAVDITRAAEPRHRVEFERALRGGARRSFFVPGQLGVRASSSAVVARRATESGKDES